jgi:tricorn protease-like protein
MILVRDIESGEERELYRFSGFDMYPNIALSPDNRWLSFANTGWGEVRSLRIMPASGGAAREVWSFGEIQMGMPNISHIWAPDGRTIMFSAPDPSDLPNWDLWQVPVEGGKPEKMGLQKRLGMWGLTILPDGRQLAFVSKGSPDDEAELWVMENFLPSASSASK